MWPAWPKPAVPTHTPQPPDTPATLNHPPSPSQVPQTTEKHIGFKLQKKKETQTSEPRQGWMEAARARALAAPAALLPALPLHSSLGVQGTRGVAIGAASATARAPSCAPPPRAPAATPAEGEVRVRIRTRARALGMGCTRRAAYLHPIYKPPCPGGGWRASPARANSMRLEAIRGGLTGRKRVCAGV